MPRTSARRRVSGRSVIERVPDRTSNLASGPTRQSRHALPRLRSPVSQVNLWARTRLPRNRTRGPSPAPAAIQARGSIWRVPNPDYPDDTMPAGTTTLIDMVADTSTLGFDNLYDFGDQRCRTVRIVKPMAAAVAVSYPLLINTVGRCPIEDSGGP